MPNESFGHNKINLSTWFQNYYTHGQMNEISLMHMGRTDRGSRVCMSHLPTKKVIEHMISVAFQMIVTKWLLGVPKHDRLQLLIHFDVTHCVTRRKGVEKVAN